MVVKPAVYKEAVGKTSKGEGGSESEGKKPLHKRRKQCNILGPNGQRFGLKGDSREGRNREQIKRTKKGKDCQAATKKFKSKRFWGLGGTITSLQRHGKGTLGRVDGPQEGV